MPLRKPARACSRCGANETVSFGRNGWTIWFHYAKARERAGGPPWTFHWQGRCLQARHIEARRVVTHTRERPDAPSNPRYTVVFRSVQRVLHLGEDRYLLLGPPARRGGRRKRKRRRSENSLRSKPSRAS